VTAEAVAAANVVGRSPVRLIAAGTIGNVLEWYDFAIYGYFAVSIGLTFFPQADPLAQVLAAFGVFAVGYVVRPLGGALAGHIGDRYGRRMAMTFSVVGMAVPTFLVGILPGYETIGILAPILLTLLRAIQGLSVGAEGPTAFTFMIESASHRRRGLVAAVAISSNHVGMLMGSGVGAMLAGVLSVDQLHDWGWRLPFLSGLLLGLIGFLLRRHLQEPAVAPARREHSALAEVLRHHKGLIARLAGLCAFGAVSFYLMFLYIVAWLQLVDGVPPAQALGINTISMVVMIFAILLAGALSDRIGRKPVLLAAATVGVVGAVPFLWLMHHASPAMILLGQLGFVLATAMAMGVQPAVMVEATPPAVRCTVIALGFNAANGLMGGLAPLAATWLVHRTGMDLSPAFLVMAAAAVSFVAVRSFRETRPQAPERRLAHS
jgi:MHS family proline/betaine transporter-like MFS transporter